MKFDEKDRLANELVQKINDFSLNITALPGVQSPIQIDVLARQLVDSVNRVDYFRILEQRSISLSRADPHNELFDPIRAILYLKSNDYDEACWLAFLLVFTGENYHSKWKFTKLLYGNLKKNPKITWANINTNATLIASWVNNYKNSNEKIKFGNHRKYISVDHICDAFQTYMDWVNANGGHSNLFRSDSLSAEDLFSKLYKAIPIFSFGRLAKFDYLSMLYKTGLADIKANNCYIAGSTGPIKGARLLFGAKSGKELDATAISLADFLGIGYQEMEDALCNWQKQPNKYEYYTG
ncbi:hypothetical protein [Acinetobacter sp.]|jgi:hypothetical protein|uniref:alpha-glutamyl/putrescinyl thymine pyrophosphorylase clade 3 protein n=1 Tax=Acinetobacter sp. TaxID=472 RepID=UPI002839ED9B|nr:hypothetical protein [Acinetobacter sp.]MDR0236519.1 hypothetical protein [Acinetobacter sp.]MDR2279165.1 hypothetical protein [Vagococcus sp.]